MNVMIIPEDPQRDHYILKPLFHRLFASFGKKTAKIDVCTNPRMGGVTQATNLQKLQDVITLYPMVNIFILCVDRDGQEGRRQKLTQLELALEYLSPKHLFFAENAWEELETWVLAGLDLPKEWSWTDIRAEISVKEVYFDTYAKARKLSDGPGGGRRHLGELAAKNINAIQAKCAEDFGILSKRIAAVL